MLDILKARRVLDLLPRPDAAGTLVMSVKSRLRRVALLLSPFPPSESSRGARPGLAETLAPATAPALINLQGIEAEVHPALKKLTVCS